MGGREVGGLANQLAAHMGFSPAEIDRVQRPEGGTARGRRGRLRRGVGPAGLVDAAVARAYIDGLSARAAARRG